MQAFFCLFLQFYYLYQFFIPRCHLANQQAIRMKCYLDESAKRIFSPHVAHTDPRTFLKAILGLAYLTPKPTRYLQAKK